MEKEKREELLKYLDMLDKAKTSKDLDDIEEKLSEIEKEQLQEERRSKKE